MARDLAAEMRQRGWITVSGAGPGIMEAAALGAGRDNTLGVNIDLPFEQSPNPYVDAETRLVEMKYFFTRKVALTKESIAFCIFPGGLGTMDETFEVLTLLHTGKSTPAPVVLCDVADGTYWEEWRAFMDSAVIAAGYLDEPDTVLFRVCHSIDGAIAEIERFYSNFLGVEVVDGEALVSLRRAPTPEQVARVAAAVPDFAAGGGYRVDGEGRLRFPFDRRRYVALRRLIDALNAL